MRIFTVIAVIALASSSSGLLLDFTNRCTSGFLTCALIGAAEKLGKTVTNMGTQLVEAGKAVLDSAVETGKNIVTQASSALLGTLGQSLDKIGKRQLVEGSLDLLSIFQQAKQFLQTEGQSLKDKFASAVSKLTSLAGNFLDFKSDLTTEIDTAVGDFKIDAASVVDRIRNLMQQLGQKVAIKFNELAGHSGPKRGISDILASASQAIQGALKGVADAMSPHVSNVVQQVTDLGAALKGQASDLLNKIKQSAEDLKGKLQSHVQTLADHGSTLVQHGKDALSATKDALAQILAQTISNAKGTIQDAISTGKDAVGVIVDHVSGSN